MKKLILKLAAAFAPLLALILFVVFVFDPYNCVHYKQNIAEYTRDTGFTRNERVIKMRYILDGEKEYDALMFGASRAAFIHADKVYPGSIYNMSYSSGCMQEIYENILVLDKKHKMPGHVYIAIDNASLGPKTSNTGFVKNYPVSGFLPELYLSYATEINFEMIKKCVQYYSGNYQKSTVYENAYTTATTTDEGGNYCALTQEDIIEADPAAHAAQDFFKDEIEAYKPVDSTESRKQLKTIKEICDKNGCALTLVILPDYYTTYLGSDPYNLMLFTVDAASICETYSFAGINELTRDNYNWYERSHFRPHIIGDMIARTVFLDEKYEQYSDGWFGAKITPENAEEYKQFIISQLEQFD
ncbi:MAG: hypothetical protein IJL87_04080 [Clostridia bacterium]|nr:hypothetical protein [Clostridia bacterium]